MIKTLRKGTRKAREVPMFILLAGLLTALLTLSAFPVTAQAAISTPITGEIERITVNNDNGIYSSGTMVLGGQEIIIPKNLLIDLPANRLTLKQIFEQAPAACVALGQSGLAKADTCNTMGAGGNATISANRTTAGNVIAGDVFIQKGIEAITGIVTYINYDEGYYRLNGILNDPATGVMVRLNDPDGRHSIQNGAGCAGGPNCSPDPRFTLDPDNYTNTFSTGYPYCIPSTLSRQFPGLPAITGIAEIPAQLNQANADGSGDLFCPITNRTPGAGNEPPVADSRRFAPIIVGDGITVEGNFETVNGVRFLSVHSTSIGKALQTRNVPDQPDYLFLDEVEVDAPGFNNERLRTLIIGYTTLAPTDVDIWSIHRDPINNAIHEFPMASVVGCDLAAGAGTCGAQGLGGAAGNNIFKIRHDIDFLVQPTDAKLSPCSHLISSPRFGSLGICGGSPSAQEEFAILSPIPHEIMARTGHRIDNAGLDGVTIDVNGNTATNGEYLFPFGLNLGGISVPEFVEIDLNTVNAAIIFEGIPWNLDRRLSPGGCLNDAGEEVACPAGTVGNADFALDPFPYSGLDPRFQAALPAGNYNDPNYTASLLTDVRDRVRSYVTNVGGNNFNFNGNNSLATYQLGVFPVDPPLIPINPTPALSIFPPIAAEDAATATIGVPVIINVLANDIAILGAIDPATVAIASPPASGSAIANLDGTITFTPSAEGQFIFTYTVASTLGAVSLPGTVTVTVGLTPVASVTLTPGLPAPQAAGTSVTFVAVATGTTGSYEYKFWLNDGATWSMVQDYSTTPFWTWSTTGLPAGGYTIGVEARNAGSAVPRDTVTYTGYTLGTPAPIPFTGVSITPSVASPAAPPVDFQAVGNGGSGTPEYNFWLYNATSASWSEVQAYSTNDTWQLPIGTAAGDYVIAVNVRNQGTPVNFDAVNYLAFTVL